MRFNKADLKEGNVSKERISEIVQQVIFKIDPKLVNPEVLRRTETRLMDMLEKLLIFKKSDLPTKEEVNQKSFEKKMLDEKKALIKVYRANTLLLISEARLELEQQKAQKDALLDKLERLGKAFAEKLIDDIHYQQRLNQINADLLRLQALMDDRVRLIEQLNDLRRERDSLIRGIQSNENNIRMIRQQFANRIIQNADRIDFLAGMSPHETNLWANGRAAILEMEVREKFEARVWRDEAKAAPLIATPGGATPQFQRAQRDAKIDQEYDRRMQQTEQNVRNQLRQLARAANCKKVAHDAPNHVFDAAIASFDNDPEVRDDKLNTVALVEGELESKRQKVNRLKTVIIEAQEITAEVEVNENLCAEILDRYESLDVKELGENSLLAAISSAEQKFVGKFISEPTIQESVLRQEHSTELEELNPNMFGDPDAFDPNGFGDPDAFDPNEFGDPDAFDPNEFGDPDAFDPNEFGDPDAFDPNEFGDPDAFDPNEFGDPDDFNTEKPISLAGASLDDLDFSSNKVALKPHLQEVDESKSTKKASKA